MQLFEWTSKEREGGREGRKVRDGDVERGKRGKREREIGLRWGKKGTNDVPQLSIRIVELFLEVFGLAKEEEKKGVSSSSTTRNERERETQRGMGKTHLLVEIHNLICDLFGSCRVSVFDC